MKTIVKFVSGEEMEEFEYPDDTPDEDIDYDYQQWNANLGNGWSKEEQKIEQEQTGQLRFA